MSFYNTTRRREGSITEVDTFLRERGITPLQCARSLRVSISTVYSWMNGTRKPKDWEAKKAILTFLHCEDRHHGN